METKRIMKNTRLNCIERSDAGKERVWGGVVGGEGGTGGEYVGGGGGGGQPSEECALCWGAMLGAGKLTNTETLKESAEQEGAMEGEKG